jgi:uncharacterized protein (DUF697 family)
LSSVLRGLTGRSMEMAEVQAEVAAECRGQILVVGRCDAALRLLLAHVRGQPPAPPAGPIYREGFFTLATLPAAGLGAETGWATEEWVELGREADVLLYVYRQDAGWQAADARWYARLHAIGLPLVLVEADLPPDPPSTSSDEQSGQALPGKEEETDAPSAASALPAGDRAVHVCVADANERGGELAADVVSLVERILAQRPKLGIPLAQEIPGCRPLIAQRAIRSGMLMTTLLGAEPIPLLDLPLQVALNWKLALQLAAIHGHPGLDHRSREMIGTVLWNLTLRYVIQQIVKLAPVLGWVASAALSGAGTWVLGNALVRYYQGSGSRHQASGDKWHLRIADSPFGWQSARRKGYEALEDLRETPARWWQVTAARYTGLRGWLVAKAVSLGKRQATVTADGPEGGFHV